MKQFSSIHASFICWTVLSILLWLHHLLGNSFYSIRKSSRSLLIGLKRTLLYTLMLVPYAQQFYIFSSLQCTNYFIKCSVSYITSFNLCRYLSIVKDEGLEISQPALDIGQSEVHHQITARGRKSNVHRFLLFLCLMVFLFQFLTCIRHRGNTSICCTQYTQNNSRWTSPTL